MVSASFGGGDEVTFGPKGAPSSAGSVVLQSGPRTLTVVLDGTTGEVEVQD